MTITASSLPMPPEHLYNCASQLLFSQAKPLTCFTPARIKEVRELLQQSRFVDIIHDADQDGYVANFVLSMHLEQELNCLVRSRAISHGNEFKKTVADWIKEDEDATIKRWGTCIVLDHEVPLDILSRIAVEYEHVIIVDHHKTTFRNEDCSIQNAIVFHDTAWSTTYLTYHLATHLFPKESHPAAVETLVVLTDYYDTFKFGRADLNIPWLLQARFESRASDIAALFFQNRKAFLPHLTPELEFADLEYMIEKGSEIREIVNQSVENVIERYCTIKTMVFQEKTLKCALVFHSEHMDLIGNRIMQKGEVDLVCVAYIKPDGKVKCSLRSLKTKTDVAEIATQYGGGGHEAAAGFETDMATFLGMFDHD